MDSISRRTLLWPVEITRGTILCLRPEHELCPASICLTKLKEAVLFFGAPVVRKPSDEVAGPWAQFDVVLLVAI